MRKYDMMERAQVGMAGKWNKGVKGWEVSKENFEREFANLT